MKHIVALVLLPLLVTRVCAAEIAVVREETRIPLGQTRSFEFGTLPQKDTTVLLDVSSRFDAKGFGGSMYFMKLMLNGRVVNAAKSRAVYRLVNKPVVSPIGANLPYSWFGNDSWRVLYAPDFEGALKMKFYAGNPYQLVFDVTDLTNPMSENRLEITNMGNGSQATAAHTKGDLVIKSLVIRTKAGASLTMTEDTADRDAINRGTPGAGPVAYKGRLLPGGGFIISTGGQQFEFATAISYPNAGLNRLVPATKPDATGQKEWTVRASGNRAVAEGPDYRLRRTVRFMPRRVEVTDEITNLHRDRKLGLLVRHEVSLKGKTASVRLAGNPDPAINEYHSNGNPSVYVAMPKSGLGLGLIVEDDVFRNQAMLFYDNEAAVAGLRTEMLCLPAGGSYTLRWSVYPVASADYFDFINLVRADWGSNYTVEGPWTFFSPDTILATPVEKIREQFQQLGIRYACYCGGWVDPKHDRKKIGFGTGVMEPYWADFRRRLREAAAKIREASPGCKVLVYYDSQRDTSDGGHERFRDSWLADPKGRQLSTEWSGIYSLTWSVVATLSNSFGRAMLAVADRYLDEIKSDGLYWDEMEATGYGAPLITYSIPDGHSCVLDKKSYTIDHEVGITTLLGEGHRMAVIDRVRAKGGTLMGNGPCATRKLLAKKPQRMVEIQHNDTWAYEGNLDSPLGYASSRMDFGNWTRALNMATLLVGTRYNYTHEISPYVFPFTPIELHAGYLLGRERIIVTHAGSYGWPGERCLVQIRHFNKDGKLTGRDFATTIGREARTSVELADGEAVVLERLPILVRPKSGTAEIGAMRYDADKLAWTLKAPGGAAVHVSNGTMKIAPRQRFAVTIGDVTRDITASRGAILSFEAANPQPVQILIRPVP
ncbi:MAG: hypothetical protein NT105_20625 [Verrucomicrobia bacterium]|nr:hypothetical protein [Verrucomicrobiota bacterium]